MHENSTFISVSSSALIDTWCLNFLNNEPEIMTTIWRDFSTSTKIRTFSLFAIDLLATCV